MTKQNWPRGAVFSFCGEAACSSCWLQVILLSFFSLLFIFLSYHCHWLDANNRNWFLTSQQAGSPRSGCQHVQVLVRLFSSLLAEVDVISYRTLIWFDWELTNMASFNLNYFLKGPISKYSHVAGDRGLGFQHMNLGARGHKHSIHNILVIWSFHVWYGLLCKSLLNIRTLWLL